MKKIGVIGDSNFPLDEWQVLTVNLEELFEIPTDLSNTEIEFARNLMTTLQLEQDDNEALLEVLCKPSGFMSFLVSVKRIVEQLNQKNLPSDV